MTEVWLMRLVMNLKNDRQPIINRQENTNRKSRYETSHTKNRTATIYPTPKSSFRRFPYETQRT